jgi:uridine kinase
MSLPLVVGIAGGTASGKTTVARKIHQALSESRVAFIDQDSYYKDLSHLEMSQRTEVNFDHPDAFDTPLLVSHILALKAGHAVEKPVYDYVKCTRTSGAVTVRPADIILVEGILVLHEPTVLQVLDLKIFVETEDDVRIIRRLTRDIKDRGRDFDHVVHQYLETVRPMHLAFVEPSKRNADMVVPRGGNNEIAIDLLVNALRARLARAGRTVTGEFKIS